MGNRNRSARLNLLLKQRDNASVTSEYVTESNGYEISLGFLIICLYYHLTDTLRSTHDVCGVNGFIRGYEYELLYTCRIGSLNGL